MKTRILLMIILGMIFGGCKSEPTRTINNFRVRTPEVALQIDQKINFNGYELIYAGQNKSGKFFIILEGASKRLFSKNIKETPSWGKLIKFLEVTPRFVKFSYENLAEGNPPEAVKF